MRRIGLLFAILIPLALLAAVARVGVSLLEAEPPPRWTSDGNDAHGDPLPTGSVARLGTIRFRSTTATNLVWLNDDRIAGGGFDNEIVVWDAATGERVQVLDGHRATLVFPPEKWSWRDLRRVLKGKRPPTSDDSLDELRLLDDGRTLISTGDGIRTWDLETGAGRLVAWPRGGNVTSFALNDGLLIYHWVECLRRFDLASGRELARLPVEEPDMWNHGPTPDGTRLIGVAEGAGLRTINTVTGEVSPLDTGPLPGQPMGGIVSADGSTYWGLWGVWPEPGAEDRTFRSGVFRVALDDPGPAVVMPHGESVMWLSLAVSPDGSLVAVTSREGVSEIRDAETWSLVRRVDPGRAGGWVSSFSPDGRHLALGGAAVSVVDIENGNVVALSAGHRAAITSVTFYGDRRIVTASRDGQVRGWSTGPTVCRWSRDTPKGTVRVALADDGRIQVTGANRYETVDAASGDSLSLRELAEEESTVIATHPDGTLLLRTPTALAMLSPDDDAPRPLLKIPPQTDGKPHRLLEFRAWDPAGARLLLQEETRTYTRENSYNSIHRTRLMDTASGTDLWPAGGAACDVAEFAGDLVILGTHRQILIVDGDGKPIRRIRAAHGSPRSVYGSSGVLALAVSPDGTRLASGGADHVVRTWSLPDGRPLRTLRGHGGRVNAVAWSPDGSLLVSGSDDTTALVWSVPPLSTE